MGRAVLEGGLLWGWPAAVPALTLSLPQALSPSASPSLCSALLPRALRTQTESGRKQELSLHF